MAAVRMPAGRSPLPRAGEGGTQGRERVLAHAKALRSNQTDAELRLWYHLRGHRFLGLKFKRQKPVGPYIIDFICREHHLIIELDRGQHLDRVGYDRQRDRYLEGRGFRVLRFWNNDVLSDSLAVLEVIRSTLKPSPPHLSRKRERGALTRT